MKKFWRSSCILLFLMAFVSQFVWGIDGAGVAFKVTLTGKIYKKLSFLVEEDIRPRKDFREAEWFLSTGELNYSFNRYLVGGAGYMLLCKYKSAEELRNRYYLFVTGSYPVGNFTFSLRERFQSTYKTESLHPKNYLRSMFNVSCRIAKTGFSPFAYVEIYNNTGFKGGMNTDKIRYSAGTNYQLNKQNIFQTYYRYHTFNVDDPVNYRHVIGMSYTHRF